MASGGVVSDPEPASAVVEDEGRADGTENTDPKESKKSRKFKPFEAMRKLFKGGRKRTKSKEDNQISVVSVKAKSTTALTSAGSLDDDDEDSDGGFKSHQNKQKLQGGKRSISEDSVFNPGDRGDPSLKALSTVTVSEENIHKNAFQNELFTKLKKRHSQYSDEDDGLPQSPVPPETTADIIMGGSLKPHPGKSSSRESEKSLISVDSSDNETDELFSSGWNSPGKPRSRSSDQSPPPDKGVTMDFAAVTSTQALSNEAAKYKLSIKPNRKTNRQSRKKRDHVVALGMPRLSEESPTKLQNEDEVFTPGGGDVADTSVLTVSTKPGSTEKPVVSIVNPPAQKTSAAPAKQPVDIQAKSSTDTNAKPASETPAKATVDTSSKVSSVTHPGTMKVEVKKEPAPVPASKPVTSGDSDASRRSVHLREKEDASAEKSSELSQALNKLKHRSPKVETDDQPKDTSKASSEKLSEPVSVGKSVTVTSSDVGSSSGSVDKSKLSVQKSSEEAKTSKQEESKPLLKKSEESRPTVKLVEETKPAVVTVVEKSTDKQISKTIITTGVDTKKTINKQPSEESNKDDSDVKSDTSSVKSESFKRDVGFGMGSGSSQTKEDYKQKRQNRSKTLPGQPQLPEEYSAKVQRAKSQRSETSPVVTPTSTASPQRQTVYNPVPTAKKMDPKRFSLHDTTPASGEPDWMSAIKKKKAAENAESKSQVPETKKDVMSTSVKDIVIKETEKPADRMTRSFTASSTSAPLPESSKPVTKKESFTINTSRAASVKVPAKADSKPETGPVRFGSVKSQSKPVNIVSSTSSPAKTVATTQSSSAPVKAYSGTTSSMTKSFTSTSSSTKPDSIKQFGSSAREPSKDTSKISPTEEAKKMFTRGQSVKTVTSNTESTSSPSRSGSVKSSSSVKPAASSVPKGSVQSDSPSEKPQKDSVPAWRSGIAKQAGSVHIEIIENEPKQEVALRKKSTPTPPADPDTCRDTSANRSSKVLDMVKNFQKLQVS